MNKPARPRRQGKGDRLLTPDASSAQIRCDHAIAPFDRAAREFDHQWGVDRLPELVSPATAERYGSAIAKLNAAVEAEDPELCAHKAAVCIRGLQAMDAEARAAGHKPTADFWEFDLEGFRIAILRETGDWTVVQRERPDIQAVYSMREVAVMLRDLKSLNVVKAEFPGAEVKKITAKSLPKSFYEAGGDPLPF